ncbi:MAG: hypothetical protein ACOYT4_00755 [Nanoarchaeota archaeon]
MEKSKNKKDILRPEAPKARLLKKPIISRSYMARSKSDKPLYQSPSILTVDDNSDEMPDWINNEPVGNEVVSKQEQRKMEAEAIHEKISPELLRHFTKKEAYNLIKYFISVPSTSTQEPGASYDLYTICNSNRKFREYLGEQINGRNIIELGDAGRQINKNLFLKLGAKNYESVDPNYNFDGLTYLMRQDDNSAIICSFGVLESGVLYGAESGFEALVKYQQKLADEIYRVTPKGAITLHGLECSVDLLNAGFANDNYAKKISCSKNRLTTLSKV